MPHDFEQRYPDRQARLVLAHERSHVARHDTRINLIEVATCCVFWFNPLAWLAACLHRRDQELACDAAVLCRHPDARRDYAEAMLKTQLLPSALPAGCHWQSPHALKERIAMLKQPLPDTRRRRAGLLSLAMLGISAAFSAWALQPQVQIQPPAQVGSRVPGPVLYADLQLIPADASLVVESDGMIGSHVGGLASGARDKNRAFVSDDHDLKLVFAAKSAPDTALTLLARRRGSEVRWRLLKGGAQVDTGTMALPNDSQAPLHIDGAVHGTPVLLAANFGYSADGLAMGQLDSPRPLVHGNDGIYFDAHAGAVYSSIYPAAGVAYLLGTISAEGKLTGLRVQASVPQGAFTLDDAHRAMGAQEYRPMLRDGIAVAAPVRLKVEFAPQPPASLAVASGHR